MIDWLKLRVSIDVNGKIPGDVMCVFSPEGELKWQKVKRLAVRGSYDDNVHVFACPVTGYLVIDGNPVKYFQGHNAFGSANIFGLAHAIIDTVLSALDLPPLLAHATIEIARVDLTEMYDVGSLANARAAVRALAERATMQNRGRGQLTHEGTVYFGKNSRRWATKAYPKGQEILANPPHRDLPLLADIIGFSQDKLRIEHVLRNMELKDRSLNLLANWMPNTGTMLYAEFMGKLTVPDNIEFTPAMLQGISPQLRLAYQSWLAGNDLRATLPRATFYRYRKELLAHGIDIVSQQPSARKSPGLCLVNIINAVPVGVPEWAIGTSSYFEPRRVHA